jgi:interleukin-like EMT inducer protein
MSRCVASVHCLWVLVVSALAGVACEASTPTSPTPTTTTRSPTTIEFTVVSRGLPADPSRCGGAELRKNGVAFYSGRGCMVGGARGWNVAAIDPTTGALREAVRNFDTWYDGASAATAMIEFLAGQRRGDVLLIAVGDEAGMTVGRSSGCSYNPPPGSTCCRPLGGEFERLTRTLEELGAREIRSLCYWNSYSLIAIKSERMVSERLARATEAVGTYLITAGSVEGAFER